MSFIGDLLLLGCQSFANLIFVEFSCSRFIHLFADFGKIFLGFLKFSGFLSQLKSLFGLGPNCGGLGFRRFLHPVEQLVPKLFLFPLPIFVGFNLLGLTGEFVLTLGHFLQLGQIFHFAPVFLHLLTQLLKITDGFLAFLKGSIDLFLASLRGILERCVLDSLLSLFEFLRSLGHFIASMSLDTLLHALTEVGKVSPGLLELFATFGKRLLGPARDLLLMQSCFGLIHLILGLLNLLNDLLDSLFEILVLIAELLAGERLGTLVDFKFEPIRVTDAGPIQFGRTVVAYLESHANDTSLGVFGDETAKIDHGLPFPPLPLIDGNPLGWDFSERLDGLAIDFQFDFGPINSDFLNNGIGDHSLVSGFHPEAALQWSENNNLGCRIFCGDKREASGFEIAAQLMGHLHHSRSILSHFESLAPQDHGPTSLTVQLESAE